MKYRKKPVIIEAFQFDGDLIGSNGKYYVPDWAITAWDKGILFAEGPDLYIKTLEGEMKVSYLDFIIQGVQGELYPCKPDIFAKTYDEVE